MGLQSPMAAGHRPLPKSGTIVGCFSSLFKSRVKGRGQPAGGRPPFHRSRILWCIYSDRGAIRYSSRERSAIGLVTRFGPDWPGKRCLAKTRRGTECQRPAITGAGRCRLHGGRSTGPRTKEALARITAANTKHGRKTKERLAEAKARAQANREIWYALKTQIELAIRDGYLPKNYRPRG
jgi:hypothetical protein